MAKKHFVHLHAHSEFSALDGASRVKDLVKKAADSGMPALAITDHGVMNSMVSLYKNAKKSGIKPIIGCEVYISPKTRFDRVKMGEGEKNAFHMVLLAKDATGLKNLNKLCSRGHLEGYYYKPRIDDSILAEHSEGLVALTACLGGRIPQHLLKNEFEQAMSAANFYKNIFGDDFYLEMQHHGDPVQEKINKMMIELSEKTGVQLIATNDSHFTNREDKSMHDILLAISTGATISKPNKMFYQPDHYFKTSQEMWEIDLFKKNPISIYNTIEVASKCNVILELGVNNLPDFPVPEGHNQATYLREITYSGLIKRYGYITSEVKERTDYELRVIEEMGFPGYLLIVWDYIAWAKKNDIPVGPGRGSAAGSIICYSIGITDIDPMEHGLLFERFLNPERVSMPDIDVDFCIEGRQRVMNYVASKYGEDKVCQIITFGTMAAKGALKDVARVQELDFSESNRLTNLIGDEPGMTLKRAWDEIEDFRVAVKNNPKAMEIFEMAKKIEGTVRNYGTHAAGVIISKNKLEEVVPLMRVSKDDNSSSSEDSGSAKLSSQTQLEQYDAEELGLLKMDFLGLRNLTMIRNTMNMIKENHGLEIDWHSSSMKKMDDENVYNFISTGNTLGLFQIESEGMTKLIVRMRPTTFGDISATLAMYRPGPLESGMVDLFVDCKHGVKDPEYPHPDLEPFLKNTYGTMIYQEQIMQIAQTMAGYTLGQADMLRRAMGKKKPEEMAKQKDIFISGSISRGYEKSLSENVFDKMAKFAEYGFNMSHSAAYAVITYRTAWLKTHYPAEFMSCLMTSLSGNSEKILRAVNECKRLGIKVLPPDVNISNKDFTVYGKDIRFGLLSIKGVGESFSDSICEQRKNGGKFKSIEDFCDRVNCKTYNSGSLEKLIKSGAFDNIDRNRKMLISKIEDILPNASKAQKAKSIGQTSLFSDNSQLSVLVTGKNEIVENFTPLEELEFERELMGIYVSSHPLNNMPFNFEFHRTISSSDVSSAKKGIPIVIMGIIREIKYVYTKKKQEKMCFFKIEDTESSCSVVCFPEVFSKSERDIEENAIIQIFGTVSKDKEGVAQIMAERIKSPRQLRHLYINLESNERTEKIIDIEKCLRQFGGDIPVVINFKDKKKTIVVGKKYWVSYSNQLIEILEKICGKGNLGIE